MEFKRGVWRVVREVGEKEVVFRAVIEWLGGVVRIF